VIERKEDITMVYAMNHSLAQFIIDLHCLDYFPYFVMASKQLESMAKRYMAQMLIKLVKMHMSSGSTTTNHFYMCSYFCIPILMQLGEEGGIDDQIVSSFTFEASVSFSPLYLRTNILYALFVGSDSILGQF
jgi:hypothetical protein